MTVFEPATPETAHRVVGVDQSGTCVVPVEAPSLAGFLLARYAERLDVIEHVIDTLSRLPRQPGAISLSGVAVYDPRLELADVEAKRQIVEWHQNWPVLVQGPRELEFTDQSDPSSFALHASQQIAWATEQEYVARFGAEPPTGPVLKLLALPYADHPDYREGWKP